MKKIIAYVTALALVLALAVVFTGCSEEEALMIRERFFLSHVSNIRANIDRYEGRVIQYEGIFLTADDRHFVVRYTEDCCGSESKALMFDRPVIGFEVYLGRTIAPEHGSWVELEGQLRRQRFDSGEEDLFVWAISLQQLSRRGAEFVFQ